MHHVLSLYGLITAISARKSMSEVISESPHTTSRIWNPHIGGTEPFPPDKLSAHLPRIILRQSFLRQQRVPFHHLDAPSVASLSIHHRNVWGVTYAIYNYTCLWGELSIYTLSPGTLGFRGRIVHISQACSYFCRRFGRWRY